MKLASITKRISAQWLALLTIFGMAVCFVPGFAQGQTIAMPDSAITALETPVDIYVVANDTPGSGSLDLANVEVTNSPDNALSLTYDENGTFTYSPNSGFSGSYSFVYRICDIPIATTPPTPSSCAEATVSVEVLNATAVSFNIIPKKLNMNKKGVVPVVIRGTEDVLATCIKPDSIRIKINLASEGVDPKRKKVPGHSNRLNLKFDAQDILGEIRTLFPGITKGDEIELLMTGDLFPTSDLLPECSGGAIFGRDWVIITGKPKH
jgi:hypothetical protein